MKNKLYKSKINKVNSIINKIRLMIKKRPLKKIMIKKRPLKKIMIKHQNSLTKLN